MEIWIGGHNNMKRSFARVASGLLALAMLAGMPVVSKAETTFGTITVKDSDGSVVTASVLCNHDLNSGSKTLKKTKNAYEGSCTEGGYQEYECWECGQKFYTYTQMWGHKYVSEPIKDSDGKETGDSKYTCRDCGLSYVAHTDNGTGEHRHENGVVTIRQEVIKPTHGLTGYGYTKETCSLNGGDGCGYVRITGYTPPLDHTYGDWYWEKKPTESTYGYARRTCTECGAYEQIMTARLEPQAKLGRITKDLTFGYDYYNDGNVNIVLARGTTFTFGNNLVNGRYVATFANVKLDASGKVGNITCYINKDDVEEVRSDAASISTGMSGLQFYVQVKSDSQVDVYSGYRLDNNKLKVNSAPIATKGAGDVLYVYRREVDEAGDYWGRISTTANEWVKLTGDAARYVNVIPAYDFGNELASLETVAIRKLADTGKVINSDIKVYNSKSTSAATVGTLKKGTSVKFFYQNVNGSSVSPFSTADGASWGYIDADTAKGLNLTAAGYILMDNISLASNPKNDNSSNSGNKVIATGIVTSSINLRVRKEPQISVLNQIGSLPTGTKLEFYEIGDANGATWGRIDYKGQTGWVCMTYVQLQSGSIGNTGSTGTATGAKENGTVVNCSVAVNVRDVGAVTGRLVTTIRVGNRVAITKLENGWGLVDGKGWVYMDYVKLDAGAEDAIKNPTKDDSSNSNSGAITTYTNVKALGEVKAGKEAVVYTNAVANANTKLLTLVGGNTFTIVDRTLVNNVTWYKTTIGSVTGWVKDDEGVITLPELSGTVNVSSLNVYVEANQEKSVLTTLVQGSPVTIGRQVTDGVYVWGFVKTFGGWVQMNNLTLDVPESNVVTGSTVGKTPITGKTNADTVVYKAANSNDELMRLSANRTLTITDWYRWRTSSGYVLRGKFTDSGITGWINLDNLDQDPVTAKVTVDVLNFYKDENNAPSSKKVTDLNLRLNASTTVVERTLVGGVIWGRVAARDKSNNFDYYWINLAGTDLGTYSLTPGSNTNNGGNNSNNNNSNNNNSNTGNNGNTGNTGTTTTAQGTIANTEEVNVRSGAGVANAKVTTLKKGTVVTVYEQKTVDNALWGRIDQGWVAMAYVDLSAKTNTGSSTVSSGTLSGNTILTSVPSGAIGVGFVNIKNLAVRNGAGLGYNQTSTLPLYTNVVIYEHVLKDGMIWGRCDQGWICTSYITYTGTSVTGSGTAGTIARCFYTANVRSSAGVGNALVAKVMVNSRVEIYEQTTYSGETWGRTSLGWVNMQYVLVDGAIPTP